MPAKVGTTEDTLRGFRGVATRKAQYKFDSTATQAKLPDINSVAFTVRGVHASSDVQSLVLVDGSAQTGLPSYVIGQAISQNVITVREVIALWTDAQKSEARRALAPRAPRKSKTAEPAETE